jgi:hypothetical protein
LERTPNVTSGIIADVPERGYCHCMGNSSGPGLWLALGLLTAGLGQGCAHGTTNAGAYTPSRSAPAAPPQTKAYTPPNPQAYQVPANLPRPAASADGVQASDFRPQFALSSRGDRSTVALPHTIPSPPATVGPTTKPALTSELRTGMNPTQRSFADADIARSIRDRGRYVQCGLLDSTSVQVQATVYDGSAGAVSVVSTPDNAVLNACIARAVQGISWARELSVRNVDVRF